MITIRVNNEVGLFESMVNEFQDRSWEVTLREDYNARISTITHPFELTFDNTRSYCMFKIKYSEYL